MSNLKEIICPRCKGYKKILGQKYKYEQLPNYKKIERGICFACKGRGVLHITEDNEIVRMEQNKILKYNGNGRYLGYTNLDVMIIKFINKISNDISTTLTNIFVNNSVTKEQIEDIYSSHKKLSVNYKNLLNTNNMKNMKLYISKCLIEFNKINNILNSMDKPNKTNITKFRNKYRELVNKDITKYNKEYNLKFKNTNL